MTLSPPHVPPRGSDMVARSHGTPPARSTRHNRPRAKKPTDRPSGDQNGMTASSEPGTDDISNASNERTNRREPEPSLATNATARPSGETAGVSSIAAPGGAAIDSASVVVSAAGRRDNQDAVSAVAAMTAAPTIAIAVTRERLRAGTARDAAPLRPSIATASSANARSRADWKRWRGSFSRHRRINELIAAGIPPGALDGSGGSWLRMAFIVSAGVAPWKARWPVSIS